MTDIDPGAAKAATEGQRSEAPPIGTGIPPALAARAARAAAGPAEVDVNALLARVAALEAAQNASNAATGDHPLIGSAKSARDLLRLHYAGSPGADGGAVLRMADDFVDAASNAVSSGNVSTVRSLGERFARLLRRSHPGNGDYHAYRQAVQFVEDHAPDAADKVGAPAPSSGALVVAGSVTG